jgi:hypothetical protein
LFSAASVLAQNWAPTGTGPTNGLLLGNDAVGALGIDWSGGVTFEKLGPTWNLSPGVLPAIIPALVSDGPQSLLFGGVDGSIGLSVNTLSRYDRPTRSWVALPMVGVAPSPRFRAAGAFGSATTAILVGGTNDSVTPLVDVVTGLGAITSWIVTPGQTSWAPLVGGPTPRMDATAGRGPGDTVVVFGGDAGGGTLLGDTWVFSVATGTWAQQTTPVAPAPASVCSMAFDPVRNVTVMTRLGETWEWNGTTWDEVVTPLPAASTATFDPAAVPPAVIGVDLTGPVLADVVYSPTIASYTETLANPNPPATSPCTAGTAAPFSLTSNSLARLGRTHTLTIGNASTTSVLIGLVGLTPVVPFVVTWGCNCTQGIDLATAVAVFLPNFGGSTTLAIPIPRDVALIGASIDTQGLALNLPSPCTFALTGRGTAVIGG